MVIESGITWESVFNLIQEAQQTVPNSQVQNTSIRGDRIKTSGFDRATSKAELKEAMRELMMEPFFLEILERTIKLLDGAPPVYRRNTAFDNFASYNEVCRKAERIERQMEADPSQFTPNPIQYEPEK